MFSHRPDIPHQDCLCEQNLAPAVWGIKVQIYCLLRLCYFSNTYLLLDSRSCHKTEGNYSFFVKWQKSGSPPSFRAVKRWLWLDIFSWTVFLQEEFTVSMHFLKNKQKNPTTTEKKAGESSFHWKTDRKTHGEQSSSSQWNCPCLTNPCKSFIGAWLFMEHLSCLEIICLFSRSHPFLMLFYG